MKRIMLKRILPIPVILFSAVLFLALSCAANAQSTITVRGEPRKPDNRIDFMHGVDVFDENGAKIEIEPIISNDEGYFEIRDIAAPSGEMDAKTIWVQGGCFTHSFSIKKQGGAFVITDAHEPERTILTTIEAAIDLGTLIEDKPNLVWVNSDVPVTFFAEDMNGNEVAANTRYKKETGMSNSFRPGTQYKIILESEKGKKWEKTITTGGYCESTRIIKRRNMFVVESFPDNTLPQIGFFRKIGLFFKGLFG